MEDNKQKVKVVVITGASSGIGRATALEFARKGSNVVLAARRKDALEELAKECRSMGRDALPVAVDVTKEEAVYDLARKAEEKFGRIDVWVNNAAVALMGPFEETPMEDIRRVIETNLFGYIYGARAVLPYFRKRNKGVLINVASMVGLTGQPFSLAYTTSKAAIRGMSLALQQELAQDKNMHVCTVLPAVIDTPLFESAGNYMGREVKPPEPILDAQNVAKTIVDLVKNPKSEVIVGGMGIMSSIFKSLAPDLYAKQYHKMVLKDHFKEVQSGPSKGNLYEPILEHTSVSGGWLGGPSKGVKMQVKNISWTGIAGIGLACAAIAAGTVLKNNRR